MQGRHRCLLSNKLIVDYSFRLLWSTALSAPTTAPTGPANIAPAKALLITLACFTVEPTFKRYLLIYEEYAEYEGSKVTDLPLEGSEVTGLSL